MTIFDSIKYPLPKASPSDYARQTQTLNNIPWNIRCIWYDHENFQYNDNVGTETNKIFNFSEHNINLLRKIILEYEDDNI
jgi:hypothetical protein